MQRGLFIFTREWAELEFDLIAVACQEQTLRATRANRVMDRNNKGVGWFLSKIADWARMCFSSVPNRRSARTGRRPRKFYRRSSMYPPTCVDVGARALRAPRANRFFCTDEKRIRTEKAVMEKSKNGLGLFLYEIATRQQHGVRFLPQAAKIAAACRSKRGNARAFRC